MDFLKYVNQEKENIIKDLKALLSIDTVLIEQPNHPTAPFGEGIKQALDHMLTLGESMGFKTLNVDHIAGHIEYGEGDEIIGVLCHLDVVPTGDGWTYPPFSATIVDDKLYARGAMDDKGPVISSLYALKILKDLNIKLNKRIRLILGTDEETDWRCIKRYLEVCEMPHYGFSPDAEFPLIYGEKGILSLDLTTAIQKDILLELNAGDRYNVVPEIASAKIVKNVVDAFHQFLAQTQLKGEAHFDGKVTELVLFGKSAHAMEPNQGVNALIHLSQFLVAHTSHPLIRFIADCLYDSRFKAMHLDFSHAEMHDLTVNVALAKVNHQEAKVGLNLRYPIGWSKENFLYEFENQAKAYQINVTKLKDSAPHFVDKQSKLVQTLHQAYMKYTHDEVSPLRTIGGGTYARALKNAVAFGMLMPGRKEVVHEVDEYLHLSDLFIATAIFAQAMYDLGTCQ